MTASNDYNWELDVCYDFHSEVSSEFDFFGDYDANLNVDSEIDICVDVSGNIAEFNVDVQAVGDDGATAVNLVAITNEEYSSITLNGYSAVA